MAGMVPLLLGTIMFMELTTGFLSAAGIIYFLVIGSVSVIFWAATIGAATITAFFFGQRLAKDYAGAAILVPYFLLALSVLYLTSPNVRG